MMNDRLPEILSDDYYIGYYVWDVNAMRRTVWGENMQKEHRPITRILLCCDTPFYHWFAGIYSAR